MLVPPLPPGRTVMVPGRGEMFVREQAATGGSGGQPIVLLHGWTASADLNWFRQYEPLAALGAVVAPDHRGHGRGLRTPAPFALEDVADDVAGLLRATGRGPAVLVGYSMGGPIALLTARRHPDVAAGVVLAATALQFRASRRERLMWRFMGVTEWFFRLGRPRGMVERFLRQAGRRDPALAPWLPWLRAELRRSDAEAMADAGRALGEWDGRDWVGHLPVPVAVIMTGKDRLVCRRRQRELAAALPGAWLAEVAADHDAPLVNPGSFTAALAAAVGAVQERAADPAAGAGEGEGGDDRLSA